MKTFAILCVVILAMADANERVKVVDNVDSFFNEGHVNVVNPGYPSGGNPNGVNVVDHPSDSNGGVVVINNPDPFFYQNPGGNGPGVNSIYNPDPSYYQNPGGNGVGVINNPDPGFYQPPNPFYPGGYNGGAVSGGPVRPDISPAYVDNRYPEHLYPGGHYHSNHPGARDGGNVQ